ncbi:HAD-like domain-containing protein [Trichophaea hybrida]|nr:HAD-like domain-containing protein [Trichophaea hybrida]
MIVSDVDGTLLDSAHTLPTTSPTYRVLKRIRTAYPSLPIIISTGKQRCSTADLREKLDLSEFPCCHLNGNVIYSPTGEIVVESGLDIGVAKRVYEEMRKVGTSVFVYDYTTVYQAFHGKGDTGQWARILRKFGEDVVEDQDDVMERIERGELNPIKMGICQDTETIAGSIELLKTLFPPSAFALTSALPFCIEMIPAAHNKGTALMALLKYMSAELGETIKPENVIVFGDGENDVSMFEVAGMSVAMGNAMEGPRKAATWVTESNDEGGVGRFLERVFWPIEN